MSHNPTRKEMARCAAALQNMPLTTWKLNDALLSHSSRKEELSFEVCNLHRIPLRIDKHSQINFVYHERLYSDIRAAWFLLRWRLLCTPSGPGQSGPPGSAGGTWCCSQTKILHFKTNMFQYAGDLLKQLIWTFALMTPPWLFTTTLPSVLLLVRAIKKASTCIIGDAEGTFSASTDPCWSAAEAAYVKAKLGFKILGIGQLMENSVAKHAQVIIIDIYALIFIRPLFFLPTVTRPYLWQCCGCSVASEGSGLSLRCVCSPCWSCSEDAGSYLILHTSPQSPPAVSEGGTFISSRINMYKVQLAYLSADQALLKVFL